MTDYSEHVAWHVWTDEAGVVHESWFVGDLALAIGQQTRRAEQALAAGERITRNIVQFLPFGATPTRF